MVLPVEDLQINGEKLRLSRITDGLFTLREYSWKFPFYFLFSQERIFMK